MNTLRRLFSYLKSIHIQKYINAIIVVIGLAADIISLALFFGAIQSPPTQSNFYVNNREFLAWVLMAIIYSLGLINAKVRRRWREKFGNEKGNNSIFNFFAVMEFSSYSFDDEHKIRWNNFQRDFSFLYIILFPIVFLFSRALTATETATGITGSPWGDLLIAFFNTIWVTIIMMVVTSMFDFAMSMFVGDK